MHRVVEFFYTTPTSRLYLKQNKVRLHNPPLRTCRVAEVRVGFWLGLGMRWAPFMPKPPEATRSHLKPPPQATSAIYICVYIWHFARRPAGQHASWNSMHSSDHQCRRRAHPLVRAPPPRWARSSQARLISVRAWQANTNDHNTNDHIWSMELRVHNPHVCMSTPRLETSSINPMSKISAICGINFSTARSQ